MGQVRYSFEGKVAIVTGGASGIGRAVVRQLTTAGTQVVVLDHNQAQLHDLAGELGDGQVDVIKCDVTDPKALSDAFSKAEQRFGRLDMLVNSAGMSARIRAEDYPLEELDRLISLNVRALFAAMQLAARYWITSRTTGAIVNLASIFGMIADPLSAPYAASKGAVIQLTKTCAVEWAAHGIRVNAVAPGYTYTSMTAKTLDSEAGKRILDQVPMKRAANVDEIANAVLFLASDAASFVTGHTLVVDGGRTAL